MLNTLVGRTENDVILTRRGAKWLYAMMIEAAPQPPDDELARLEREIAEADARDALWWQKKRRPPICEGEWVDISSSWVDISSSKDDIRVRYLELRGLLERHPTDADLVRVKVGSNL
jgi:hypothetical protein